MSNFISQAKARIASDRADSNTISQLLWIVLAVVVVLAVGAIVASFMGDKAREVDELVRESNDTFQDAFNG